MVGPTASGSPIVCFGEVLLRLNAPAGARLSDARNFEVHVGGAEANVAAALAALGHEVELVTALPANALGSLCIAELRRAGIGTRHIVRGEGRLGTYFIEHGSGPRPAAIVYDRAGSVFAEQASQIQWPDIAAEASWFHLSGINLPLSDATASSALAALEAMTSAGVPVSFDVNHRSTLWGDRTKEAARLERRVMQSARVLFASAGDLSRALGRELTSADAATAAFDAFPDLRYLISTRRETATDYGQTLSMRIDTSDGSYETESIQVGPVVDRIGSGDALAGAAIDAILRESLLVEIARQGIAAGILKIGIAGDRWTGTRNELTAFHDQRGSDVKR